MSFCFYFSQKKKKKNERNSGEGSCEHNIVEDNDNGNKRLSRESEGIQYFIHSSRLLEILLPTFLFLSLSLSHIFIHSLNLSLAGEARVTTPTVTETQLPWKRDDEDDAEGGAIKQHEFPAWASNKEYLAYNSPSATFLGKSPPPKYTLKFILFSLNENGRYLFFCVSE